MSGRETNDSPSFAQTCLWIARHVDIYAGKWSNEEFGCFEIYAWCNSMADIIKKDESFFCVKDTTRTPPH